MHPVLLTLLMLQQNLGDLFRDGTHFARCCMNTKKGVTALQDCKKSCRLEIAWRQTQRNPNVLEIPNAQLATRFGLSFIRKCCSSPRPAPSQSSRQGGVRRGSQPWLGKATFAGGFLVSWLGADCICHVLGFSFHTQSGGGFQHCPTM